MKMKELNSVQVKAWTKELEALLKKYFLWTRQAHISLVFLWLQGTATVLSFFDYHVSSKTVSCEGNWSFLTQLGFVIYFLRRRRNLILPSVSKIGAK